MLLRTPAGAFAKSAAPRPVFKLSDRAGRQTGTGLTSPRSDLLSVSEVLMKILIAVVVVIVVLLVIGVAMSVRIVKQYEQGVLFRLGRALGARQPGLRVIIPFADVLHRVSLRIVTMPIQSQGIITRDNVSVDVSAVAYFRVVDAVKSVV